MNSAGVRFTAHQLALGWREVRVLPRHAVTLTCEGGLFVVRAGTAMKTFRTLAAARLLFDNMDEPHLAGEDRAHPPVVIDRLSPRLREWQR
jgi:hypothetical protein